MIISDRTAPLLGCIILMRQTMSTIPPLAPPLGFEALSKEEQIYYVQHLMGVG